MELTLSRNDPLNTALITADGNPVYHVSTAGQIFGTANTRIMNVSSDIGMIEWHSWGDCVLMVGRRQILPQNSGMFSSSQIFQASDGQSYKWKVNGGNPLLVVNDHSRTHVAMFLNARGGWFSTPRPASLGINPLGIPILDDIITTFVWFEQKRRQRERSRRNAASSNASNLAASNLAASNAASANAMAISLSAASNASAFAGASAPTSYC